MNGIRDRIGTYLELASKAKGIDWKLDEPLPDDYWFVKLLEQSPTEGVWAAQKLLEAVDLFERIIKIDDQTENLVEASECLRMVAFMARDFLEGGER